MSHFKGYDAPETYWQKPELVITCHISWDEIAGLLELDEDGIILDGEDPPAELVNEAFEMSQKIKKEIQLEDTEELELENLILASLLEHWKPETVILANLNINRLIEDANNWSKRGAFQAALFGASPPIKGLGIIGNPDTAGIMLTVYQPFQIPFIESYYQVMDRLPDKNLEDLSGLDIFDTLITIQESMGRDIDEIINLKGWEENYQDPTSGLANTKLLG